jgi:uncharacterized membrane protein YdjX (TVP38/TMEM64 family)
MALPRLLASLFLLSLAAWVILSWQGGGVMALILATDTPATVKLEALRSFFVARGAWAPLVYVALVLVEAVIAPIPGAILYLPGGVIIGGFQGGTLSLIGNVLAAGLCCVLTRSIVGERWLTGTLANGKIDGLRRFILEHGVLSITLLRINPLTSSDLVSYAAGLTPLRIRTVMLGTLIGMAPLCYLQAYLSMELFTTFPWLIWPFLVVCGLYAGIVAYALWHFRGTGKS